MNIYKMAEHMVNGGGVLVIIPARGGSKGIPRKNLRPLNGKPLISYSIGIASSSKYHPDIFVSTDDDEIAFFSKKYGASIHMRNEELAQDEITLDPVIIEAYKYVKNKKGKDYDAVITMQPTSPLLKVQSLDDAIDLFLNTNEIDTIISAVNDTHLSWERKGSNFIPNYKERVNRQFLPEHFKETGGFVIADPISFSNGTRIGKNISLYELSPEEAIDIDGFNDWALCEFYLKRKNILFVVSGYSEIGLGHIYNTLGLANEILSHNITFLLDKKSELGYNKIKENNYKCYIQSKGSLTDDIIALNPDVIINDRLDTSEDYMRELRKIGAKIINIEDLGEGTKFADLVINAIYPETEKFANHYYGSQYFCARDEFLLQKPKEIKKQVTKVLISFGGVDPCNLTEKVLSAIYNYCLEKEITITVITGMGYKYFKSLDKFQNIHVMKNVKNISDYFQDADIVFSSAGRTIYELSISGTPTIVLAQNEREMTHFYATKTHGFINLGLGDNIPIENILSCFKQYISDFLLRKQMSGRMKEGDVVNGKKRVIKLINNLIEK